MSDPPAPWVPPATPPEGTSEVPGGGGAPALPDPVPPPSTPPPPHLTPPHLTPPHLTPPPPSPPLPLPLAETAALVGEYRWIEDALYRLLGSWVTDMPLAAVQVHLDAQCMRHAWHAELWAERLPVHDGVDPDALTGPSPPSAALLAGLAGAVGGGGGPAGGSDEDDAFGHAGALPRLAGLYRVALPRLVTTYERHLGAVAPVTDAPVARALRLVLNDEVEDWRAGERLVEGLVTRPHDVAAVHEFLAHLESAVVAAGAVSGLVALPPSVPGD